MELQASEILEGLVSDEIQIKFDTRTNKVLVAAQIAGLLNPKFKEVLKGIDAGKPFKTGRKELYSAKKQSIHTLILPLFELFYKNNYVNSYFLNQLIAGDYAAFADTNDQLKRYAGVFAPGIRGFVDETLGMKSTFKTLVLDDTHIEYPTLVERLRAVLQPTQAEEAEFQRLVSFFDTGGYDATDAQGFMLPARVRELSRGFERA